MPRIIWKENRIISIELRKGLFILAQMHINPHLIFYNIFRFEDRWDDVNLNQVPILFYTAITKQFLQNTNIVVNKNVKPLSDYTPPVFWIKKDVKGHRNITFWEGTKDETTISTLGEGRGELLEKNRQDIKSVGYISPDNEDIINAYELTNIRMYPELCERLYLCSKYKKNVDPLKAITFNQKIPLNYITYLRIMNGSIDKDEWLSLTI